MLDASIPVILGIDFRLLPLSCNVIARNTPFLQVRHMSYLNYDVCLIYSYQSSADNRYTDIDRYCRVIAIV